MRVDGRGTREPEQMQATYLEKLADELSHRGLEAWLMAPPGRVPSLYVVNPAARALEENVYAGCGKDGIWWFWWSWAERIAVADDIDLAATTIVRVLASLRHGDLRPSRLQYVPACTRPACTRSHLQHGSRPYPVLCKATAVSVS